jgi:GNAT superfamily N-acetyltransferase
MSLLENLNCTVQWVGRMAQRLGAEDRESLSALLDETRAGLSIAPERACRNGIVIRSATTDDAVPVAALLRQMDDEHISREPSRFQPCERLGYAQGAIEDPALSVVVAILDDTVVGVAILAASSGATAAHPAVRQERTLYLVDLVVDRAHRSKGAAFSLMDHCFRVAAGLGFDAVAWNIFDSNTGTAHIARRFFPCRPVCTQYRTPVHEYHYHGR